jgi:hypothetical protein
LTGLTNWTAGTVNLDAIVRSYKRIKHYRVMGLFAGNFPLVSADKMVRPPVRVEPTVSGNTVLFDVWVDQSHGVPTQVPSLAMRKKEPGWRTAAGIAAVLAVLIGGLGLIAYVVFSRRRADAGYKVSGEGEK